MLEPKNGRYEGCGQKLAIRSGRLLFAGPPGQPGAVQPIYTLTKRISLTGQNRAPDSRST